MDREVVHWVPVRAQGNNRGSQRPSPELEAGLGPGQEAKARGEADPATTATAATLTSAQLMGTS